MDLSKLKTLALLGVAAGLATQPAIATENEATAEGSYYVASCGGNKSCGGGYPAPYNQTNRAPTAMNDSNGTQDPAQQRNGDKNPSTNGKETSRYYQKRDSQVSDATPLNPPSNGLLPDQQKKGGTTPASTNKSGTSSSNSMNSGSGYSSSGSSSGR